MSCTKSKDINANGYYNDNIIGLDAFIPPFPEDIDRKWIVSNFLAGTDLVVLSSSQYIYEGDTLMTTRPHISIPYFEGESSDYYSLLRGLDEPSDQALAYEIKPTSTNKGFITYQINNLQTDIDLFKLSLPNRSSFTISMLGNEYSSIDNIQLLDDEQQPIQSTSNVNTVLFDTLEAGPYYIRITGTATTEGPDYFKNSYDYPYTLITNATEILPGSLVATPSALLEYYDVVVNEYRDKIVTLTNNGSEAVSVTNVEISGTNADQFSVTSLTSFAVPPLGTADITVRCSPTDTATKTANLEITNTSTDAPIITIPLHSIGVDSATRRLIITPDITYNYGNVNIYQNRTKTFQLKNTGSDTLSVTGLSFTGMNADAYSIISQPTVPFDIATGIVKQVTVKFLPTSIGVKTADFVITNNSDNTSPQHAITLYGNGKNSIYNGYFNTNVAYEYWFDDNYAGKVYTTINPQQVSMINTTLSTAGLNTGLHKLHIRTKDEKGRWSSVVTEVFHKLPILPAGTRKITEYEYWFDNDYAEKINLPNPPQQICILDTAINATPLSVGLHTFHTRFKDDAGQWSSVVTEVFHKMNVYSTQTNLITEYRYWFDMADSIMMTVNLPTPVNPYQLIQNLNTCSMALGSHTIHFQFKDANGAWSSVITDIFSLPTTVVPVVVPSGTLNICEGESITLTTDPANSYQWSNGATTQEITVSESGNYSVTVSDACGSYFTSGVTHVIVSPLPIPQINGQHEVCEGNPVQYATETGMTDYTWTISEGGTITGSSTGQAITVNWDTCGVQWVRVNYTNAGGCHATSPTQYDLIVKPLPEPAGIISGPDSICKSEDVVIYTVPQIANANSYNWTLPVGASGSSTTNSINVTFSNGAISGDIIVKGLDSCGYGVASVLPILVNGNPGNAGVIEGDTTIVPGQSDVLYSVPAIMDATNYIWELPQGASGTSFSNEINVSFSETASPGIISVRGHSACGDGEPYGLLIHIYKHVQLKLFLEGLFNTNNQLMKKAQDENGDHFEMDISDQVNIQLRNQTMPYSVAYTAMNLDLKTNGICEFEIPAEFQGTYYIVIKHRNHLETWSKSPVSFAGESVSYDFSTSEMKAFGDNQKQLATGKYGVFAGDVNGDGKIDDIDIIQIKMSCFGFLTGFQTNDVNGDGIVDVLDLIMVDNNTEGFIKVQHP